MAGETQITVVGNLTSDPELRYTQSGLAVANFTIASTPRSSASRLPVIGCTAGRRRRKHCLRTWRPGCSACITRA